MNAKHHTLHRWATLVAPLLAVCTALGGCDNGPSLDERLDTLMPQRTREQSATFVQQQVAAQVPAGSTPLAQAWAGAWQGRIAVGGASSRVSGVATASGLILLVGSGADYTLEAVQTAGNQFTARLTLPNDQGVRVVAGRFEPGLFDGLVLPTGWSLADYLGGRSVTDAERLQFGRLTLAPDVAVPALPSLAQLATREVGNTPQGGYAVELDAAGNLAMIAPGCELAGAVTPSPSVSDHFEVAVASAGSNCDATGDSVGIARMGAGGALEMWLRNGGQTHRLQVQLP